MIGEQELLAVQLCKCGDATLKAKFTGYYGSQSTHLVKYSAATESTTIVGRSSSALNSVVYRPDASTLLDQFPELHPSGTQFHCMMGNCSHDSGR
jgi:hypothetical protein